MRRKKWLIAIITGCIVLAAILLAVITVAMRSGSYSASMFSWHREIGDATLFDENKKILEEYQVGRVYQYFSKRYIESPEMEIYMQNASKMGVEVVCLAGDKSWVYDGLEEYKGIVDALVVYNLNAEPDKLINAIALDVECHTLPEWSEDKKQVFYDYLELMKEAKEYANKRKLKVIQVIPTFFDAVDETLFEVYLLNCCDELSVMNYNRENAARAIQTEYDLCIRHGIPIETIFEFMPVDDEHGVTEDITYHYDSDDVWQNDYEKLKEAYGSELGIGLHYFTVIKEKYMAEH